MVNARQAKIYTFYSYKGGVGRSMALANIAELLYQKGLSVLMVDFDLEAPGLEQYFYKASEPEEEKRLREIWTRRGVIDLLFSYKSLRSLHDSSLATATASDVGTTSNETPPIRIASNREDGSFPFPKEPLANFITEINPPTHVNPARLSLMTAGRRSKERISAETNEKEMVDDFFRYADRVRSFAWDDFYLNWDGERFFEWFRIELINSADVVLIDSRTGVAEMSGVCTYQLADIAVMFVASNNQNVEGTKKIAESLTSQELIREGRKGRDLSLVFVPSRVDLFEKVRLDDLAERFKRMTDTLISPSVTFKINAFDDLKIPYIPYYSFVEELAVRDKKSSAAIEMTKAYENICRSLAQLDPVVKEKLRSEGETSDKVNVAEQLNRSAENVFAQLTPTEQDAARSLFTRLLRVARIEEGEVRDTARYAKHGEFAYDQLDVAEKFIEQGLLTGVGETIGLADERLLSSWMRLNDWVNKNRDFLLWRQDLQGAMAVWERAGRRHSDLLPGSKYEEAKTWLNRRQSDLNGPELAYIIESSEFRRRNQLRTRFAVAAAILMVLTLGLFISWRYKTQQSRNATQARSRSLAVASEAVLPSQPTVSLALAIEAARASATIEAQEALKKALLESNLHTVIQLKANPNSARFSHDGKQIVIGYQNGDVALWQFENDNRWQTVRQQTAHLGDVVAAIFSPDDQLIATAGGDGRVNLWDAKSGRMIAGLAGPMIAEVSQLRSLTIPGRISDISFSRDGRLLAAASEDTRVYVWDIKNRTLLTTLRVFNDAVNTVDFSENHLIASDGNKLGLWSVKDWRLLARSTVDNRVLCVRFSNDNSFFVTTHSDGTARVWSLKDGEAISIFSEHKVAVTRASFSPDARLIVTAGNETTAMIWEAMTGKLSTSLRGAQRAFTDASFSPDGTLVLTAEAASLARLWDVRVDVNPNSSLTDLINQGCSRLIRNMTKSEWQQYVGNEPYRATCSNLASPSDGGATQQ